MDGEQQMLVAMTVEFLANLFQSFLYIGFLYLLFDKPEGKLRRALSFFGAVFVFFGVCTFFTLNSTFFSYDVYYLDSVLYVLVMLLYSLIFLRGKLYLRIIMPLIAFGLNALVSFTFVYFASAVSGLSIADAMVLSSDFRYLCIAVVNITFAVVLWLVYKLFSTRIWLSGAAEITAFIVIPVLCLVVFYCGLFIHQMSGFSSAILPYILSIYLIVAVITILTCFMLVRIGKANEIKTELLLTTQREKLYEESILSSNEQIKTISSVKHDMKNHLNTVHELISKGSYQEASQLCHRAIDTLSSAYTPINTPNPVLNAIVNVEQEKAASSGIDFQVEVNDHLTQLSSEDTVSLVGNLCDNAIEYLVSQPADNRKMSLKISSHMDFAVIVCKNSISHSVLESNPDLLSTKSDKKNHGKGVSIVRKLAAQYGGSVSCKEADGWFEMTVFVNKNQ